MPEKNDQGKMPELPKEARWRFEEAAMKVRPLFDALLKLEEAIQLTFDVAYEEAASWLEDEGEYDLDTASAFYFEDAIEAARLRRSLEDKEYEPDELEELMKVVVDLLTNWK
jgi:hypothetical protein